MVIGITGIYCSGKSIASSIFHDSGFRVIDVDSIGHEALEKKKDEIVRAFSERVLKNNLIDRKELGKIVFNRNTEMKRLELIVHPWMVKRVKGLVKKDGDTVINAALLIEMGLHEVCDFVLGININKNIAVERGMARDNLSKDEALRRLRSQISLKEKLHFVDKVIDNKGNAGEFKEKVRRVVETVRSKV
jgi:dephospho-CoA kinase